MQVQEAAPEPKTPAIHKLIINNHKSEMIYLSLYFLPAFFSVKTAVSFLSIHVEQTQTSSATSSSRKWRFDEMPRERNQKFHKNSSSRSNSFPLRTPHTSLIALSVDEVRHFMEDYSSAGQHTCLSPVRNGLWLRLKSWIRCAVPCSRLWRPGMETTRDLVGIYYAFWSTLVLSKCLLSFLGCI